MKHPALTRVMAITLAVLCLTMAAAGALGLNQAGNERRLSLEDMERLRWRVEEYCTLSASLEGSVSGETLNGQLTEQRQTHEKESAQHRSELGIFTATQYGLGTGLDAIDQAEAQFATLKTAFEQAMTSFRNGMAEIDTILNSLWTMYDTVKPILDNAHTHLNTARGIGASLDSGEELTYAQVAAAYDELLGIADESVETADALRGLEPAMDALAAVDITAITEMISTMEGLAESLKGFGDIPLDGYQDFNVDFDFDMDQIVQLKQGYDQAWAAIKQGLAVYDEASAQAAASLEQLTGTNAADLRAQAQAMRDELAARGDEPVDPAEREAILAAWRSLRDPILQGLDTADAGLQTLDGYTAQIHDFLSSFQAKTDGAKALMKKAQEMIAAAEEAMFQARALIWLEMGKQREKEEELWERKDELDQEARELEQLSGAVETQEEKEKRQSTLRMNILSRSEIKERCDTGEELGSAALAFLDETVSAAEATYAQRRVACLLMLFGAFFGLLGIPAAFETVKSRLMLILPLLHCLGCAAGAQQILWKLGRGLSYSSLAVMSFALLQLLVSRPKKRKRKTGLS